MERYGLAHVTYGTRGTPAANLLPGGRGILVLPSSIKDWLFTKCRDLRLAPNAKFRADLMANIMLDPHMDDISAPPGYQHTTCAELNASLIDRLAAFLARAARSPGSKIDTQVQYVGLTKEYAAQVLAAIAASSAADADIAKGGDDRGVGEDEDALLWIGDDELPAQRDRTQAHGRLYGDGGVHDEVLEVAARHAGSQAQPRLDSAVEDHEDVIGSSDDEAEEPHATTSALANRGGDLYAAHGSNQGHDAPRVTNLEDHIAQQDGDQYSTAFGQPDLLHGSPVYTGGRTAIERTPPPRMEAFAGQPNLTTFAAGGRGFTAPEELFELTDPATPSPGRHSSRTLPPGPRHLITGIESSKTSLATGEGSLTARDELFELTYPVTPSPNRHSSRTPPPAPRSVRQRNSTVHLSSTKEEEQDEETTTRHEPRSAAPPSTSPNQTNRSVVAPSPLSGEALTARIDALEQELMQSILHYHLWKRRAEELARASRRAEVAAWVGLNG